MLPIMRTCPAPHICSCTAVNICFVFLQREQRLSPTYLTAVQHVVSRADGEVQVVYWVWSFQAAEGAVGKGRVIYRNAGVDRNVAHAQ